MLAGAREKKKDSASGYPGCIAVLTLLVTASCHFFLFVLCRSAFRLTLSPNFENVVQEIYRLCTLDLLRPFVQRQRYEYPFQIHVQ